MTCYLALFASDSHCSPTGSAGQAAQQLSLAQITLLILIQVSALAEPLPIEFETGTISTSAIEYGITFAPDGQSMYFVRDHGQWGKNNGKSTIYHARKINGEWSNPVVAGFSGQYNDSDPHVSADGQHLYFISDRPVLGVPISADIWVMSQDEQGLWHDLKRISAPINSEHVEYSPSTTANGDLYFASDRSGGMGQRDLYRVRKTDGGYGPVENLGQSINSATEEWNLTINDVGDMLIFEASGRPGNLSGAGDLYISFLQEGTWSKPQHMRELNSTGSDLYPEILGDALFYASNGRSSSRSPNIYQIDFKNMREKYKMEATKSVE